MQFYNQFIQGLVILQIDQILYFMLEHLQLFIIIAVTCTTKHLQYILLYLILDEDEESNSPSVDQAKPSSSRSTGGSHIHLWQFLKELLASPQTHGSCIRWLDRSKGIFKIEDSVRVARLWGKRKNRPAMNYDKLSRSIRQYYKKGIMKKTERSQRLVYQFCHPYNL